MPVYVIVYPVVSRRPAYAILVLIALASNDGSGEPAQMRRLARAFAASIHKV